MSGQKERLLQLAGSNCKLWSLLQRVHADMIITGAGGLADMEEVPLSNEASRAVKRVSKANDECQGDSECRHL